MSLRKLIKLLPVPGLVASIAPIASIAPAVRFADGAAFNQFDQPGQE